MKYCLLLISIFFTTILFSQEAWTLPFSSRIEKNGKKLQGATISLMQGGKTVVQTMTGDDGGFKIQIPANGDFVVVVTKQGHCTKKFTVSTRGVPNDKKQGDFKGFNVESISLFEPLPGIDYSVLNQPLVKVAYDASKDNFDYDEAYSNQMLSALERLRQLEQDALLKAKELEANYTNSIKAGDNAFKKKDWAMARAGYNQALTYKPNEQYPKDQLAQIEVIIKDQEALNKKIADEKAAADALKKKQEEEAAAKKAAEEAAALKKKQEEEAAAKKAAEEAAALKKKQEEEAAAKKAAEEAAALKKKQEEEAAAKKSADEAAALKKKQEEEAAAKKAADEAAALKKKQEEEAAAKKAADEAAALKKKQEEEAAAKKAADEAAALKKKQEEEAAAKKAADEAAALKKKQEGRSCEEKSGRGSA
jgi:hypothetical protein